MSPALLNTFTEDHKAPSQKSLGDLRASLNTHLVRDRHASSLTGEITGLTANDLPYIQSGESYFEPGVARANVAATTERPRGTTEEGWNEQHRQETVLQQHVSYWDQDNDGVIWPRNTYDGVRAWGWGVPLSMIAMVFIHAGLSYATQPTYLPDPVFRIYSKRIHRAKHGSDTMTYDNQGRFRPQAFEDIFANYDRGNKGGLDKGDLYRGWYGQRVAFDFFGWSAALLEWVALYLLIWPEDGILRKEEVRQSYDGSLFQLKADQYAARKRRNAKLHGR